MFLPRASIRVLDEENDDGRNTLYFAELVAALGPQQIAQTGDNSYPVLFGAVYVLELRRDDNRLHLYRRTGTGWLDVTSSLPSGLQVDMSEDVRRITLAFDQSARPIVAYEENEIVKVTRWDTTQSQYSQNVTFTGTNPALMMDATLADPLLFPESAQAVINAGISLLFEWLPDGQWRTNALPDSDIVLFYQTPDRQGVRARVQRQGYGVVNVIHDYAEPVIFDDVVALFGAYQLLVSDDQGAPLEHMLISDGYIGGLIPNPRPITEVGAPYEVLPAQHRQTLLPLDTDFTAANTLYEALPARYTSNLVLRAPPPIEADVVYSMLVALYEAQLVAYAPPPTQADAPYSLLESRYRRTTLSHAADDNADLTYSILPARYQEG